MAAPEPYLDHSALDFSRPVADAAAIREVLPHRFEMEMLTAIVHVDREQQLCVGYKDLGHDEFWCRGHFPGMPVMPGVLMCEAAAQICAWYALTGGFNKNQIMGLGGIDNTRFRRAVKPGDRLILVGKGIRVRPRMTVIGVQGFVGADLAFHTEVIGLPIALRTEVGLA